MAGRRELAVLCYVLALFRFVAAMLSMSGELVFPNQVNFNAKWKWSTLLALSIGAVNDVIIAGGLVFYLRRSQSGIKTWAAVLCGRA